MSRPPELFPVAVAAAGALALGVGAVAMLNTDWWGIALVLGGAVLLGWSLRVTRRPES
jgi:hypothetical protein